MRSATCCGCEAGSAQADAVEADDHRRSAIDRDKRRHVLPDAGQAADHRQPTDAAELVHRHTAREKRTVGNGHVSAKHRVVGKDHVIAERAVVGHVGADHQQAAVADPGDFVGFHRPVDGHVLADHVAVANHQPAGEFRHVQMLRHAAQHRPFADDVAAAQRRAGPHHDPAGQRRVIANFDARLHDRERADLHVVSDERMRTDGSKWVNRHKRVLIAGRRSAPVSRRRWRLASAGAFAGARPRLKVSSVVAISPA